MIKKVKDLINTYNIKVKKNYGQNFLIDENVLNKIIEASNIDENTGIIEIGPGLGSLTQKLLSGKKVLCYEIDQDMVKILEKSLNNSNLIIKQKDFMLADIEKDLDLLKDCDKKIVVSNLPYYLTTPIIFKLLESNIDVNDYYLMVQKEVALRLTGKPKTKDYNALSVLMEYKTISELLFIVKPNSFYPAPEIDSAIIHIHKCKKDYGVNNDLKFLKFIQDIFIQRRKTLVNNISSVYKISKANIKEILLKCGFKESARSEELTIEEIVKLYKAILKDD